jgi:hypothetical protein
MLERVDETVLASWQRMAGRVRDDLVAAGLPVCVDASVKDAGAVVEVDPFADDSGGEWVYWKAHPALSDAAADAVEQGRLDDPAIQRSGTVKQVMRTARWRCCVGRATRWRTVGTEILIHHAATS